MAIRFDASTDGTTAAVSGISAGAYTLLGWVYITTDLNTYSGIASFEGTTPGASLSTRVDGSTFTAWDTGGAEPGLGGANATAATWYRFAVTVGAGTTALYTGLTTGALTKVSAAQTQATAITRIAFSKSVFGDWFNGRLHAVKVWNATLSDDEVALELSQNRPVRSAGLVAWYPAINDLKDYSGNGYDMVAGSTATTVEDGPGLRWDARIGARLGSYTAGPGAVSGAADAPLGGLTATVAGSAYLPISAFTDNFNDNSIDSVKWPFTFGPGAVAEAGGKMTVAAATAGDLSGVYSAGRYKLADDAVAVQIVPPALNGGAWAFATLTCYVAPAYTSYARVYVERAAGTPEVFTIGLVLQEASVVTRNTSTPAAVADLAWVRLRESGGTTYAEYSPTGAPGTWVTADSFTTPASVRTATTVEVDLETQRATGASAAGAATFDNLNLAPTFSSITGSAVAALGALTATATGTHRVAGAAAAPLGALTAAATGSAYQPSFTWSGHTWDTRDETGAAPGPNDWDPACVEIDGTDLLLTVQQVGGVWSCPEIRRQGGSLGYGRYRWSYTIDAAGLDPKMVLGLFTYEDDTREIDIETSLWNASDETSRQWYTNQPGIESSQSDHTVSAATPYTAEFIWQSDLIYWRTVDANGALLGEHVVTANIPPEGAEQVRLNAWLIDGDPPTDGLPMTATIHSFEFAADITHDLVPADEAVDTFDDEYGWALHNGAAITGGELVLPCVPEYSTAYTGSVLDLRGSSVQIDVAGMPAFEGDFSQEVGWYQRYDQDNYIFVYVAGGGMAARLRQGGVNSSTISVGTYNPVTHRHWRISHSGTSINLATSPDGSSWTTHGSLTTSLTSTQLSTMRTRMEAGYWSAEPNPTPGDFVVAQLGAAPNVSGTASAPLGALTATATGTRRTAATATAALGGLVATASGAVRHTATAASALGALTATATATVRHPATATAGLGALTATAAGARRTAGTAAAPLGPMAATAAATVRVPATASAPLGGLVATASGATTVGGSAAAPLGALTAVATATVTGQAGGAAAAPLGPLTATATGRVGHSATATAGLGGLTAAATATVTRSGTAAAALGPLQASASAGRTVTGAATAPLGELAATAVASASTITAVAVAPLGALTAATSATITRAAAAHAALGGVAASAVGEAVTPGGGGGSVRFDAPTDMLVATYALPAVSIAGITVALWARLDTNRGTYSCITRVDTGGSLTALETDTDGQTLWSFGAGGSVNSGIALTIGAWYRIAITIAPDGAAVLYVAEDADGTVQAAAGTTGGGTPASISIGGRADQAPEWSACSIAYERVWSAVLTQTELEAEWSSTAAVRTTSLVADWPLESADDLTDHSGNNRHLLAGSTPVTTVDGPPIGGGGGTTVSGVATATLGALTATAAGATARTAAATAPLGALTATAAGARRTAGTATAPLGGLTATAAATLARTAVAAAPLGGLAATGSARVTHRAVAAASLGTLTATAAATATVPASATASLGPLTATATARVGVPGVAAAPLGALTAAADATPAGAGTGSAVADLGGLTAAAAAQRRITGAAHADLGALQAAAAADGTTIMVATADLGGLTADATAVLDVVGAALAGLGPLLATAAGTRTFPGAAASQLGPLTATAVATVTAPTTWVPPLHAGTPVRLVHPLHAGTPVAVPRPLHAGQPTRD